LERLLFVEVRRHDIRRDEHLEVGIVVALALGLRWRGRHDVGVGVALRRWRWRDRPEVDRALRWPRVAPALCGMQPELLLGIERSQKSWWPSLFHLPPKGFDGRARTTSRSARSCAV
jgi:hypothetical protein